MLEIEPLPQREQADRFNEGKPKLSLVMEARYALEGCADVLEFGLHKYSRGNWKKGMEKEALIDSMLRHILKVLDGEELDEESGLYHVDHILCNSLFLSYHHNGRKDK